MHLMIEREGINVKRIFVLLAIIILGILSTVVYLSVLGPTASQPETIGFHPYETPIPGQEVSLDQAQASVPFKIKMPTDMGTFVLLKRLQPPEADSEAVYIIYAVHKPSKDATFDDVINQNGIILMEFTNDMTLQNSAKNIRAAIDSTKNDPGGGLQEVSINGYVGCAGGNVAHCVDWYTETNYYRLMANVKVPLQQLIEIAQNIPIN